MAVQSLMKDKLGTEAILNLAQVLSTTMMGFTAAQFIEQANSGLERLELKQRVDHVIAVLADYLPRDFADTSVILLAIKADQNCEALLGDFTAWPLVDYVAIHGLNDPELSLKVLKALTSLFSAEFAIRPFIEVHFELTYPVLLEWCTDHDEHVRRLASEGIRPRLPWGKQLKQFVQQPDKIFTILERLKDDDSLYVRRSVANNLNDIAKDNPDKVIALCQSWSADASADRKWLIRHSLRSLIKQGRSEVFPLLGYTRDPLISTPSFGLSSRQLTLGEKIGLLLTIESNSQQQQKLVVDYQVHHMKANGQHTTKVFKWKNITLAAMQKRELAKQHPMKRITTRQYYAGLHKVDLLINGKVYAQQDFELIIR